MQIEWLIVFLVLFASFFLLVYLLLSRKTQEFQNRQFLLERVESLRKEFQDGSFQNRQEISQRIEKISDFIQTSTRSNWQSMESQFKQSAGIIQEVTRKLTELDATNKQILDFSGRLQSLEHILKNPKHRGILGEYFLETLLSHVFPPHLFQMQYKYKNGDLVDAVIHYHQKLIPIDAKFSLEKYNRMVEEKDERERAKWEKEFRVDVKNRIAETSKYINSQENTTDFAFMFIPAEGIYYYLLSYNVGGQPASAQDIIEFAFSKQVILVSPTTLFAYLETVLQGMKTQQIQDNIQTILKRLGDLGKHLKNFEEWWNRLGKNLDHSVSSYNSARKEFLKVDKDIFRLTNGETGGTVDLFPIDQKTSDDDPH